MSAAIPAARGARVRAAGPEPLKLAAQQRWRMVWIRESFDDGIRDVAVGARSLAEIAERAPGYTARNSVITGAGTYSTMPV